MKKSLILAVVLLSSLVWAQSGWRVLDQQPRGVSLKRGEGVIFKYDVNNWHVGSEHFVVKVAPQKNAHVSCSLGRHTDTSQNDIFKGQQKQFDTTSAKEMTVNGWELDMKMNDNHMWLAIDRGTGGPDEAVYIEISVARGIHGRGM